MNQPDKKLIVIGDSFSTPFLCVEPQDSFWGLAGRDLRVTQIVNYSQNGLAFDLVMHILLNEQFDWHNCYFIIGVPPVARVAMFIDRPQPKRFNGLAFDRDFQSWPVGCNSLTNCHWQDFAETFAQDRYFLANYDHAWQEILTLEKIWLIHNFLRTADAKFVICNLTVPMALSEDWEIAGHVVRTCKSLPECILFENTPFDLNQKDAIKPVDRDPDDPDCWFGHHGKEGNGNWYQKILKPKLEQLNWL